MLHKKGALSNTYAAITAQITKTDRRVYKKRFDTTVGVDGRSGAPCYFATVIYDQRNNCIVAAYPTV